MPAIQGQQLQKESGPSAGIIPPWTAPALLMEAVWRKKENRLLVETDFLASIVQDSDTETQC